MHLRMTLFVPFKNRAFAWKSLPESLAGEAPHAGRPEAWAALSATFKPLAVR